MGTLRPKYILYGYMEPLGDLGGAQAQGTEVIGFGVAKTV